MDLVSRGMDTLLLEFSLFLPPLSSGLSWERLHSESNFFHCWVDYLSRGLIYRKQNWVTKVTFHQQSLSILLQILNRSYSVITSYNKLPVMWLINKAYQAWHKKKYHISFWKMLQHISNAFFIHKILEVSINLTLLCCRLLFHEPIFLLLFLFI